MFLTLLLVTFLIAALVAFGVARLFDKPLRQILGRLVAEDLSAAWHRYIVFAIYVVGISGGVRAIETDRDHLYVKLRATPAGLPEALGKLRTAR